MLKTAPNVRLTASLIKITYDSRHRGAATSQQHSIVATSYGCVIRNCCPMQWETWAEIPQETKILVRDKLSDISPEVITYLDETFANRYKNWKSDLHVHFKKFGDPQTAHLEGCPSELQDLPGDWEWLCNHFTDPKFVKKSIVGKIARDSKTLLHHSGLKPFSYRLEARRQAKRVLSSQRSTCLMPFTFNLAMRPLSNFMLLWWKRAMLFTKKQHRSFPRRPRSRTSLYPRM